MITGSRLGKALLLTAFTTACASLWAAESNAQLSGHIIKAGIYVPAGSENKMAEPGSATGFVTEGGRAFQFGGHKCGPGEGSLLRL
jgi:hypothetical protein